MLDIENMTKVFYPGTVNEKLALDDINLHVNPGDVICVIGSNGSGKSTLFNLISGTYPVTSGQITLDGKNVTTSPEYKRAMTIGRIFQDPTRGTAANMSIEDNMITAATKGMKGLKISLNNDRREEFRKLLEPIGMQDRLKDNVGLLSGGQRQALTLLMTVMSKPRMLLLDEHTAALDPRNAQIVMNLTERYIKEYNLTALMVTHNMQFAIDFGNRLIMMDEGSIILDVCGEDKKKLTVSKLVELFKNIRKKDFDNDEGLLTSE
jgi:putative ABC transport system ATP-binding protein